MNRAIAVQTSQKASRSTKSTNKKKASSNFNRNKLGKSGQTPTVGRKTRIYSTIQLWHKVSRKSKSQFVCTDRSKNKSPKAAAIQDRQEDQFVMPPEVAFFRRLLFPKLQSSSCYSDASEFLLSRVGVFPPTCGKISPDAWKIHVGHNELDMQGLDYSDLSVYSASKMLFRE